jgi:hypothetical protein
MFHSWGYFSSPYALLPYAADSNEDLNVKKTGNISNTLELKENNNLNSDNVLKTCLIACLCNRVLRTIFGPKREEVTKALRKLHNEELHNLHSSPNISKVIEIKDNEMGGTCSRRAETKDACTVLFVKPEENKSLTRPWRRS